MERLRVDPAHPDERAIQRAAAILRAGGVVAFPTDTLYGLAADPGSEAGVARVFAVKGRPPDRPLPLIAADVAAAARAGSLTPLARRLAGRFWPGPLTLIAAASEWIAPGVHQGTGRVGVRVADDRVARALARAAGGLITATSANRSGEPPSGDPEDAARLAEHGLDALLDAGAVAGGAPSTIVDVSGDEPVLVRAGVVPWERVLESLHRSPE